MRQFERLVQERPDLGWLMRDTAGLLGARHFVAHAVPQQDGDAEGHPALFVLSPRQGETMITTGQTATVSNSRCSRSVTGDGAATRACWAARSCSASTRTGARRNVTVISRPGLLRSASK
jgi:hypothetical protein